MRLYVIRHAQSANNALPEEQRIEDPPITDLGHQQARALAKWLEPVKLDHLIASPFRRSLETAEYIRKAFQLEPHIWIDLHEQGGCYAGHEPHLYQGRPGLSRSQIAGEFPHYQIDPGICERGWWKSQPYESDEQAMTRAIRLIQRTVDEFGHTDDKIAYVMHADFKRLFLTSLFANVRPQPDILRSICNTAVTIIEFRHQQATLEVYNSIEHLSPELVSE